MHFQNVAHHEGTEQHKKLQESFMRHQKISAENKEREDRKLMADISKIEQVWSFQLSE